MTTAPTYTSRPVISQERLETWKAPATRGRHLSEDPKKWYNTQYSCHICGKYTDRPVDREEHYKTQHDGALFPEEHPSWSYGEWACHVCGKGFDAKEPRDAHYKRYHPKIAIKWPDGQPADAWHIRPQHVLAERRPMRNAVIDIGQSGGSGEVIDFSYQDEDDENEITVHDGDLPPPASQNQKGKPAEVVEIDELDSVISAAPRAQPLGPAARLLANLNQSDWSQLAATSPIFSWAMDVQQETEDGPIEIAKALAVKAPSTTSQPTSSAKQTLPVSPQLARTPPVSPQSARTTKPTPPVSPQLPRIQGQAGSPSSKASPSRTAVRGVPARPERAAQRSTFHGRIQRSLYNAGLQFNKISENMTSSETKDNGGGSCSDSLQSGLENNALQSKELDPHILRPLFDVADVKKMNEELDLVVNKINIAVKILQSDHHLLAARERVFAQKKELLDRRAAKIRDEHGRDTAKLETEKRELQDRKKEIEEEYAERCAILDVRENDLEDREADLQVKQHERRDQIDEQLDSMECDEGFEDAVEQMMEA